MYEGGNIMAWWLRQWISGPRIVVSIPDHALWVLFNQITYNSTKLCYGVIANDTVIYHHDFYFLSLLYLYLNVPALSKTASRWIFPITTLSAQLSVERSTTCMVILRGIFPDIDWMWWNHFSFIFGIKLNRAERMEEPGDVVLWNAVRASKLGWASQLGNADIIRFTLCK